MSARATGSRARPWGIIPHATGTLLRDLPILLAALAAFYALLNLTHYWLAPPLPAGPNSSGSRGAARLHAAFSVLRPQAVAYVLSLLFTFVYGYVAAYNRRAEMFLIPLLDTLQSIPVLSFLPGVMLAMVALFPGRQLGVELGAILLIFTGQVWNMAFSFYASLKSIPREMNEAARIYRFSWWQRFIQVELPYSVIGLVWNSMMSVAGGWFFLMACEMFPLGPREFRLPGLGSYLQTAAAAGDTRSILLGVATMVAVIVLLDQFIWRPIIAWAEKFKIEQVESTDTPQSWVLNVVQRSTSLAFLRKRFWRPTRESLMSRFAIPEKALAPSKPPSPWKVWISRLIGLAALGLILFATVRLLMKMLALLESGRHGAETSAGVVGAGRDLSCAWNATLLTGGAAWTIPVRSGNRFKARALPASPNRWRRLRRRFPRPLCFRWCC